jgi:hypothetical protein
MLCSDGALPSSSPWPPPLQRWLRSAFLHRRRLLLHFFLCDAQRGSILGARFFFVFIVFIVFIVIVIVIVVFVVVVFIVFVFVVVVVFFFVFVVVVVVFVWFQQGRGSPSSAL